MRPSNEGKLTVVACMNHNRPGGCPVKVGCVNPHRCACGGYGHTLATCTFFRVRTRLNFDTRNDNNNGINNINRIPNRDQTKPLSKGQKKKLKQKRAKERDLAAAKTANNASG